MPPLNAPPLNRIDKTRLALALCPILASPVLTQAAVITVNSNLDDNGNGCTLREALVSANSINLNNGCALGDAGGVDTITFANSLPSNTIVLSQSHLYAYTDVIIDASAVSGGVTIDANQASGVMYAENADLTLNNITLTGGQARRDGGGISVQNSSLTLLNSRITGNVATGGEGGGIYLYRSQARIANSAIINNTANPSLEACGGGICIINSYAEIVDSTIANNRAYYGGGIGLQQGGELVLNRSTVANNIAESSERTGIGGGIHANLATVMVVDNSTIANNSAGFYAGGVFARGSQSVNLTNSTISSNSVIGGSATSVGGIYLESNTSSSAKHITLANNSGVGISNAASPNFGNNLNIQPFRVYNSIIVGAQNSTACVGSFTLDATTIVQDGSCEAARSGDPGLLPLANNGGPTQTHALLPDSIARNSSNFLCVNNDQRGQTRRIGDGFCDVGAFEFIDGLDDIDDSSFFVVPLRNGKAVIFEL